MARRGTSIGRSFAQFFCGSWGLLKGDRNSSPFRTGRRDDPVVKDADEVIGAVHAEQVGATFQQVPIAIVVNVVNAGITATIVAASAPTKLALLWFCAVTLLALGQDQHLGRELDLPRAGREEAEQHKWVMEKIGRRVAVAPIRAAGDIDAEDVVGCGQILITDLLGRLREFTYGGWIAADSDIDKGQRDAKFHLDFPPHAVAQPV